MRIQAVLFDMDNLLVDTEPIESRSQELLITSYGKRPKLQKNGLMHTPGAPAENTYINLQKTYHLQDEIETLRKKRRKIFEELIEMGVQPMPGMFEVLNVVKQANLKIGLASNRNSKHIILILDKLGIQEVFDVITGPSETLRGKPFPDMYLETAKNLGVNPQACVVLEDSESGVISAKSAQAKVIAIPNKYTDMQNFEQADKIAKSLSDITIQLLKAL